MKNVFEETIDIDQYPKLLAPSVDDGAEMTIGDLHANTMTLICLLTRHGIITNMTEDKYNRLRDIYKKPVTEQEVAKFEEIINDLEFKTTCTIRLIGDEFADRGNNDLFTILLFKKMNKATVPYEILLSNHGFCFISAVLQDTYTIREDQRTSVTNLKLCLKNEDYAKNFILTDYLPEVKLLSYTIDETNKSISIYSHAPIGLENIQNIANAFGIGYNDSDINGLTSTIDQINTEWQKRLMNTESRTTLFNEFLTAVDKNPFHFLMWNRRLKILKRPAKLHEHDYDIQFVHGHTTPEEKQPDHIVCLDGNLGKCKDWNHEPYRISIHRSNHLRLQVTVELETLAQQIKNKALKSNNSALKNSANTLAETLLDAIKTYKENVEKACYNNTTLCSELNNFTNSCQTAIKAARPELEKHRGFKDLLAALMVCLTGIGIPFVIYKMHYQKDKTHHFFKTRSHQLLDEIEKTLSPKMR